MTARQIWRRLQVHAWTAVVTVDNLMSACRYHNLLYRMCRTLPALWLQLNGDLNLS